MYSAVAVALLALVPLYQACVPTQSIITTTTIPCCPMLSQTSVPKRNPSSSAFEQCSILRRMSSTCPVDGVVFCDAAPDTNPARMQIEFFDVSGNVVRTVTNTGNTLAVTVFCKAGKWTVSSSSSGTTTFIPIATVSCAQQGSTGADRGYVIGSAVSNVLPNSVNDFAAETGSEQSDGIPAVLNTETDVVHLSYGRTRFLRCGSRNKWLRNIVNRRDYRVIMLDEFKIGALCGGEEKPGRGRRSSLDDEVLRRAVEANPETNTHALAKDLGVHHRAVAAHLVRIGKVKKMAN
ncbi:unnamed protein product [Heligmosomoides polygyrus]|uniref:HTH_Tnp_ISL3 domain-containing protein n=1 Tax=Heligmosomoides polygyrus TaxID=6339 RepID=A0A3P8CNV2_HELPZ|nr:unnamed protein product [Heligmosomoides polygyrus]